MSIYQKMTKIGSKLIGLDKLFKYGFNLSPMYRRSTAKISSASKDLYKITIKLPISYKNKNYVNSIFGGSMFSAIDPIPMVQLINILGDDYMVWDKSAEIFFKRPAREDLFADFEFTSTEVNDIKSRVAQHNEIEIIRVTKLTDKNRDKVFCEVHKTIYIADKNFYKEKRKRRKQ
ncbi:DUF4442 domain-containing protein [uncultured Croceitalea sp.]|uniref:PaaI family thioesterase n=1 Tax=uncultured Croceitalea sp. TaxID=1798908 RepID=UPI00330618A4